ncbi:MAG: GtrA family protein [Saprospiraceae bacterium]|nr:GtrA family protein [Saprospiraceae bacterium]
MKKTLTLVIDTFYFPFRSWLPLKTYRYAVCGGSNLVLDILLYFIFYNFIFVKTNVDLLLVVLSPHIASLFFVFPITFLTGFALQKYITFEESNLPGRIQLFRYFVVAMGAIVISYALMKLFVDGLHFYPTPSRLLTILVTVVYSYIMQNKFSFQVR